MRTIVAILVLILTSCNMPVPVQDCEVLDATIRVFGPELPIQEVEKIGVDLAARNKSAPQVPFAMSNRSWERAKANYRTGDVFQEYEGPIHPDGHAIAGGYLLLRGSCIVERIGTWRI